MPSEAELRDAIRSSANIATTGIDADAVVRKARARRVPKQLAFSSLSVLAIVGIGALGITALPLLQAGNDGASTSGLVATVQEPPQSDAEGDSAAKALDQGNRASNLCGMPTVSTAPAANGLELSVNFPPSTAASRDSVAGVVTITNSAPSRVSGTITLAPIVTVSRDGITVWHTDRGMNPIVMEIDLAPGQSRSYDAYFQSVECGPEDDASGLFRDNLPLLSSGRYAVTAKMTFIPSGQDAGDSIVVSGPGQDIEIR